MLQALCIAEAWFTASLLSCSPPVETPAVGKCVHVGMRRCVPSAWGVVAPLWLLFFFLFACSHASGSCKVWVRVLERDHFCFLVTESFICSSKVTCEKEETGKLSACLADTVLCVVG